MIHIKQKIVDLISRNEFLLFISIPLILILLGVLIQRGRTLIELDRQMNSLNQNCLELNSQDFMHFEIINSFLINDYSRKADNSACD